MTSQKNESVKIVFIRNGGCGKLHISNYFKILMWYLHLYTNLYFLN